MKTVKYIPTGRILREADEVAHALVSSGVYVYCPKSEWKKQEQS